MMMVAPGYLLTVTSVLVTQAVTVASVETYCPPPVKRFLRINEKIYRKMNGAVIRINEVPQEEVVRLSLKPNPYYSSPKCGVLEGKGFSHFGVREEYDIQSFQKTGECQVYLAKSGLGTQSVDLSLLVITDLVSGLSSECRPEVSVRLSLTVSLCSNEWGSCEESNVTEAAREVTEDPANYEAEYVTNCDSEWGCEPVLDSEECPGEWGCVSGVETTLGPLIGEENEGEEEDVVVVIYNTLMSPEMTPVTISVLFIVGVILLLSMWCLLCRKRSCSSSVKKPQRSLSTSSTMTSVASDRTISGPIPLIPDHEYISRGNSDRNSSRSSQSLQEVKVSKDIIKAKKRPTSGSPEIERHYQNIDVIKTENENVFIVPREVSKKSLDKISERDPTEEGLESGEWCNNKTRPKTKHKRQQSRLSPSPSYSLEMEAAKDVDDPPRDSLGNKLPAVVANSYKIAQKDLPVTFY